MKTLDQYVIREVLPPMVLALGLLTFLLAVRPALDYSEAWLAKGVAPATVGFLLLLLLPQSLGITIPMSLLTGILMGLGRLSTDREAVAMLACGVSPLRILRPVMLLAVLMGTVNLYVLVELVPDANQRFRVETARLLGELGARDIRPGVVYEGFPNKAIMVGDNRPGGGYLDVTLADTSQPGAPAITRATEGFLLVDEVRREVALVFPGESARYIPGADGIYDFGIARDLRIAIPAESVFGSGELGPSRGAAEMTIADLRQMEADKIAAGISPHPEVLHRHQRFSFPVACLVFALIGVALGLHTRREGKMGGLMLGLGVTFVYYAVMALFENLTKGGQFSPYWARWMPNIIVGVLAILAMRARLRNTGRERSIALPAWVGALVRRTRRAASPGPGGAAGTPDAAAPVVVVLRIPDIRLPRLRLLDRYVSEKYLRVAVLSFVALLGLYYIGTFIDKSERLFKGEATTAMLLEYFYHSTPQIIVHVAPMAVLVAVLATIGGLTRTGELVVMRACGVSLYRVGVPLVALAMVWSSGLFFLDDRVLAQANRRAEVLENRIRGGLGESPVSLLISKWRVGTDGTIYYYSAFDPAAATLYGLSIFEPAAAGPALARHAVVSRASHSGGQWRAESGWEQVFPVPGQSDRSEFTDRVLALPLPEVFADDEQRAAEMMPYGQLRQYAADLAAGGRTAIDARVELERRVAFPFVTFIMTVLGLAFGVSTGKRGALYGVGLALVLGAGYWFVDTFFIAIGQAGLLTPWLAAWAANLLFVALAIYAVLTVRT